MIASILNRMGRRTAYGQTWNAVRICAIRQNYAIAVYCEGGRQARGELNVAEVPAALAVTETTVLRLAQRKILPAIQACANAPWVVRREDMERFLAPSAPTKVPEARAGNQLFLDIQ